MTFRRLAAILACLAPASPLGRAADPPQVVAPTAPKSPADEQKTFHLPEGFEIQLVASEPAIHKPMNFAFDELGRLWVTETLEYPFAVADGKKGRDGVKILSEFRPDGEAAKVETFVDGLNIPIGILPLPWDNHDRASALVYSIPHVLKITDNGWSNRRETTQTELFGTYGQRDTHGMTNAFTWGFDGWVYATHGFSNESKVQGADKQAILMQSGNTYRMRPDGSHLEYYAHGQVNPFGLAFDPLGNLYSSDCHSRPVYQLLRGAYYPSFGKPDDGLGFGPEMAFHDHGSTGIAGIVYYAAEHFPEAYRDTIYIGNVVTNRINHDKIEWHGSTPKAIEQPDFLVSDDPWFRPVDIKLGPDGALYIADFYNRIIGHYEVPLDHPGRDRERGRIWRVVYRGKDGLTRFDAPNTHTGGGNLPVGRAIEDLGNPNLTVRMMATNQLDMTVAEMPPDRLHGLVEFQGDNPWTRVHALWLLHRRQERLERAQVGTGKDADVPDRILKGYLPSELLEKTASDPERAVRVHTMRILGERRDLVGAYAATARKGLNDPDPHVQRAAAEALGRHPDTAHIKPLLALRAGTPADDTHLIHAARMAIRDQFIGDRAWEFLDRQTLSDRESEDIADVAPGVPSAGAARFLLGYLQSKPEAKGDLARYVRHVARYAEGDFERPLLAVVQLRGSGEKTGGLVGQMGMLKAMHQGVQERGTQFGEKSRAFALALTLALLDSTRAEEVAEGIASASDLRLDGASVRLAAIAGSRATPERSRAEALSAIAAIDPNGSAVALARSLTDSSAPIGLRERAAALLAGLSPEVGQAVLMNALATAPERLQQAIGAGLAARPSGASAVLDAVAAGKASARLLQDGRLAGLLKNAKIPGLDERLATLLKGLPPADERLSTLIAQRRQGFVGSKADAALGAKVFETNCAACHQIGGKGPKVGPQLDGIGVRGLDRTLEDVLDPNRNVDQTFRASSLALKDGRVFSGLLMKEEGAVLVMADAQGKEVRVPKDAVEERSISPLSPMPANFSEKIGEEDFYRLVAYLLSQRPAD